MDQEKSSTVLVTGASGYISSHLIKLLLEKGYKVRGSVRSLANKDKYKFLYDLVPEKKDNLEIVEGNLTDKACWDAAVDGCDYIFHVASPVPPYVPEDENEIIGPAVEGTVNILEASLKKGVKKVVVTSSGLAIYVGNVDKVCSEDDWSKYECCDAYPKAKVKAEKAAWEFYEKNKDKIEVSVCNPCLVLGPELTKHGNSSETLIADIMNGKYPGITDVEMGVVDVRDVAEAQYRIMFKKGTTGKRYLTAGESVSNEKITNILKDEFGKYGLKINDKHVSKEEVIASGNKVAQRQVPNIGMKIRYTNERSRKELDMQYRDIKDTLVSMGHSLIDHEVVKIDKSKVEK